MKLPLPLRKKSRILFQEHGEDCVSQHCAVEIVRVRSAEPLSVSLHPLAVPGKLIRPSRYSQHQTPRPRNVNISGALKSQAKLLLARQRSCILMYEMLKLGTTPRIRCFSCCSTCWAALSFCDTTGGALCLPLARGVQRGNVVPGSQAQGHRAQRLMEARRAGVVSEFGVWFAQCQLRLSYSPRKRPAPVQRPPRTGSKLLLPVRKSTTNGKLTRLSLLQGAHCSVLQVFAPLPRSGSTLRGLTFAVMAAF